MVSIGVCGLGLMGDAVARRLAAQGHDLHVWARRPGAKARAPAGVEVVADPRALADLEVVITWLGDANAVSDLLFGTEGFRDRPPGRIVQMATLSPGETREFARRLRDVQLIDAPVIGGVQETAAGTLRILVGAAQPLSGTIQSVLAALGTVTLVGSVGDASAMKLVVNAATAPVVVLLAEALAIADRLGLDGAAVLDVLEDTRIGALVKRKRSLIVSGDFRPAARLRNFAKDMDLIISTARDAGVPVAMAPAALALARDAIDAGLGELDYSVMTAHARGTSPKK